VAASHECRQDLEDDTGLADQDLVELLAQRTQESLDLLQFFLGDQHGVRKCGLELGFDLLKDDDRLGEALASGRIFEGDSSASQGRAHA